MTNPIKRAAVIGAGISGVTAAAHLKKEGIEVTVFERSSAAGGICPCYIGLKNNVSTRLLETTLNCFPAGTEDFVTHNYLSDYIQDTSIKNGVHEATRYNTNVKKVVKSKTLWSVDTETLHVNESGELQKSATSEVFETVVVASGHYHAPRVPPTPGLAEWKRRWPDRVQHSKRYRSPEGAKGKNYLLVGGSVSSTDIARELGPLANRIYQSQRQGTFDLPANLLPENGYRVDEVASYNSPISSESYQLDISEPIPATVTLKSGEKLCDIHHVILCTGYHLTLPFLSHLHADSTPASQANDEVLVTDGTQFHNLHKDIFYIPDPSLVFIGVPFYTATFTLFEFQAMVVAKVLSGQAKLPSEEEMHEEYWEKMKASGHGKAFHSLKDKEKEYVDELLEWVNEDLKRAGRSALSGHSEKWQRAKEEQVVRLKAMFGGSNSVRGFEVTCQ
ncbi:dimethylaniline monooxygenase [Phaeosphaeria sp. MPI-PUGE-AT-0046c]|nr:dimethylaniline monooxygenase [Phaeosphaeria sp. MPI-PUGE-AT-0046c]